MRHLYQFRQCRSPREQREEIDLKPETCSNAHRHTGTQRNRHTGTQAHRHTERQLAGEWKRQGARTRTLYTITPHKHTHKICVAYIPFSSSSNVEKYLSAFLHVYLPGDRCVCVHRSILFRSLSCSLALSARALLWHIHASLSDTPT